MKAVAVISSISELHAGDEMSCSLHICHVRNSGCFFVGFLVPIVQVLLLFVASLR